MEGTLGLVPPEKPCEWALRQRRSSFAVLVANSAAVIHPRGHPPPSHMVLGTCGLPRGIWHSRHRVIIDGEPESSRTEIDLSLQMARMMAAGWLLPLPSFLSIPFLPGTYDRP